MIKSKTVIVAIYLKLLTVQFQTFRLHIYTNLHTRIEASVTPSTVSTNTSYNRIGISNLKKSLRPYANKSPTIDVVKTIYLGSLLVKDFHDNFKYYSYELTEL